MRHLAAVVAFFALSLSAQTPSFEAASIRPVAERRPGVAICGVNTSPLSIVSSPEGTVVSGTRELFALISDAYQDQVDTIVIPAWIRSDDRFQLSVRIPPSTTAGTCRQMLRNLLAERFHLVTAVETMEVGRFYVRVAKSGLRMKPVDNPPSDPSAVLDSYLKDGRAHYSYHGAPMSRILDVIGSAVTSEARARGLLSNPSFRFARIVDETGLTGYYDATFDIPILPPQPGELTDWLEDTLPSQVGLTLEFRKAPGKVLVIRSGDRMPTEN